MPQPRNRRLHSVRVGPALHWNEHVRAEPGRPLRLWARAMTARE
jgi:hypothetical protein